MPFLLSFTQIRFVIVAEQHQPIIFNVVVQNMLQAKEMKLLSVLVLISLWAHLVFHSMNMKLLMQMKQ